MAQRNYWQRSTLKTRRLTGLMEWIRRSSARLIVASTAMCVVLIPSSVLIGSILLTPGAIPEGYFIRVFPVLFLGMLVLAFIGKILGPDTLARYQDRTASEKRKLLQIGDKGERHLVNVLDRLPDDFYLYRQVRFPNAQSSTGTTEVDLVVITPAGSVISIEIKNVYGVYKGCQEDSNVDVVRRHKGEVMVSRQRNPIRQAVIQRSVIRDYLSQQGVRASVNCAVYLAHPLSSSDIESDITVFDRHEAGELFDSVYKLGTKVRRPQTQSQLNSVVTALLQAQPRDTG